MPKADVNETPGQVNETPHQVVRMPVSMWEAFGRVCGRRGVSRAARIRAMITADIREHGDAEDLAALEAAETELRNRRARRGIPHRRRARS